MAVISSAGGLTPTSLETIIWLVVAIAILFALFRFTIRLYVLKRLQSDDGAVVNAVVLLLAMAAMYRKATPIMFKLDKVAKGEEPPTAAFLAEAPVFLKLQFAIIVMFWTEIWMVKISFLIFYRNLFTGLPEHMLGWWFALGFTVLAYLLCWAFQLGSCVPISHYFILGKDGYNFDLLSLIATGACETPRDIRYSNACLYVAAVGDIITDLMIMGLGLRLLWNLQINLKEKLALGAIFSVGLIKITFAVIRVVRIGASARHVNPIWLALWSMIEASVAVVVACLPSFKVLFAHGRRQSEVRRALKLKTFQRRRSRRHSNDMVEPLDSEVPSEGARTPVTGTDEARHRDTYN
ncbi:MAG: hypothetical protein Q9166_002149 [cf. Caloplaca sp. 2 TL-2023]